MSQHDTALDQDEAPVTDKLGEVFNRAMTRFRDTVMPQQEMRAEAMLARRFIAIPGAMWEGPWGQQFDKSIKVEIDKISRGVEKIITDYRQHRIVPDFRPAGGGSDEDTADTLDGLMRADAAHFKSQQAYDNAFEEAVIGGFGAWRLTNELADPYDKDSDEQRINPAMIIVDADQRVFFDGNSKAYDKHDARFCFVLTAMTRDAFDEEYGVDNATDFSDDLWKFFYDWFSPDVIKVAEYYEKEIITEKLFVFTLPLTEEEERFWESDLTAEQLEDMLAKGWTKRETKRKRCRVHKYTISGAEVLRDHGYIAGEEIPVVPVYGKRYFVDNQERFRGHVSKRMDSQRIYNAKVSKLAETDSLAPREIPIFAAQQMPENIANMWRDANIERYPYLIVEPLIDPQTGNMISPGPIGKVEPPQLAPVTAGLLQIASNDLTEDDQNADEVKANTSAEAMDIAATRVDAKSGIYLDNMGQSAQRGAEIYKSMSRDIYFEPGREVEVMDEEGGDGIATLHEPFTDKSGIFRIRNDLTRGKYKVVCTRTEATATRKDKTVRSMLYTADIATKAGDQELARVAVLTAVMNQDGEGTGDMQAWARKQLVGAGVVPPNEEERQQMEQAAEGEQPSAAEQVLTAQAQELSSKAKVNEASAVEKLASAQLKTAQAEAVGGPEQAPETPSGLTAANDHANVVDRLAGASLKDAQAAKIRAEIGNQRIKTGHEIKMSNRQQDFAERTAARSGE